MSGRLPIFGRVTVAGLLGAAISVFGRRIGLHPVFSETYTGPLHVRE